MPPLVVPYLIACEGAGIAFVVHIALTDKPLHHASLCLVRHLPAPHLLQQVVLAVLAASAELRQLQVGSLFRHFFHAYLFPLLFLPSYLFTFYLFPFIALIIRCLPNWSVFSSMSRYNSILSMCCMSLA